MALNWDKLSKLRTDITKPNFANKEIARQIKKRPKDPYLLAWKADVSLELGNDASVVTRDLLLPLCKQQPPLNDKRLLVYIYGLVLKATRRQGLKNPNTLCLSSAGDATWQAWDNAAKSCSNRNARLEVWSALFACAMKEDCWEDVRHALQQANQERPTNKKTLYFSLILAYQLAGEQTERTADPSKPAQQAKIQLGMAYNMMKKAYTNAVKSSDDIAQVHDMRDLRFMGQIFKRQRRAEELISLWKDMPPSIRVIYHPNATEIHAIQIDTLKNEGKLTEVFNAAVQIGLDNGDTAREVRKSWSWSQNFIDSLSQKSGSVDDAKKVLQLIDSELQKPGSTRELELSHMTLNAAVNPTTMLALIKTYWQHHCSERACYQDLRQFLAQLSVNDQEDFLHLVNKTTQSHRPSGIENEQAKVRIWLHVEYNGLRFTYLLQLSRQPDLTTEPIESFVCNAIRLSEIAIKAGDEIAFDIGSMAVAALLLLHDTQVENELVAKATNERQGNHHYLLQAGLLLHHLVKVSAGKNHEKDQRATLLLSTRIHLYLGLGTIAYEHYRQVKVKEMLHDTLSYVFLTNISQAHPFDVTGPHGFSADKELVKVVTSIERMESKIDEFLFTDMQNFVFDQALDLLDLKRKLRTSLTKHLCIFDRRRIAQLKGEPGDYEPPLKTFDDAHDNRDLDVVPNPEYYASIGTKPGPVAALLSKPWHELGQANLQYLQVFLSQTKTDLEQLVVPTSPESTGDTPSLLPYERGLNYFWGHIELLQAISRLPKTSDKRMLQDLVNLARQCFDLIGKCATSRVEALKKRGVEALVAQGRAGSTGEALRQLVDNDEMKKCAREYVDSAIEALNGVLKAKMGAK
ncbi:hypothetical protein EJ04DRAFT_572274 [Polyplosphaeria fusca]|uniref:Uncharacterized protein n=1 Tax=Polyplosphaeria fusca TaxID=682080 RepID=A0A9P4V8K9_9PLEO|nr:hypothetical protein EJ04DRAFT_572274 [Polyplosphaeria fusca]